MNNNKQTPASLTQEVVQKPTQKSTREPRPQSSQYVWAQVFFWGGYLLVNLVLVNIWGRFSAAAVAIFACHTLLLVCTSHGLRHLYHRQTGNNHFSQTIVQLLWVLPLGALIIQSLLHVFIYGVLVFAPVQPGDIHPFSLGSFIGYSLNTTIILALWSMLYLLRREFKQRRETEIAHWRDQAKLRDMELQFLRSQINSHFLFNSLNNVRALILEDPHAARQGLADLATLLRGLLQTEHKTTISLREELEWVRGYLALESLQFEQRLSYALQIDAALLDEKVPPLLVQTLVENAIKHGIARRRSGGHIHISADRITPTHWQLIITNPAAELPAEHGGNSVGLANTRARLAAAFGDQARFDLALGVSVSARVDLPIAMMTNNNNMSAVET